MMVLIDVLLLTYGSLINAICPEEYRYDKDKGIHVNDPEITADLLDREQFWITQFLAI